MRADAPPALGVANAEPPRRVLAVLAALMAVNLLDRQILAILAESIRIDLDLSDTQLGVLGGLVFSAFYATLALPLGRLSDRTDRVGVLAGSAAVWSLMTAACGLAGSFSQLALARIGVAVGEAGGVPPAHSLIADYYPPERRGRAMAVMQMGAPIGVIVAFLAGGWLAEAYGWRVAFVVAAVPGVAVSLAALRILPEPRRGRLRSISAGDENFADALRALASLPSLRWLLAGAVFSAFAIFSVMAWLPVLFQRSFDWSAAQTGVVLGPVLGISGLLGTWIGGVLGDRWQAREPGGQIRVAWLAPLLAGPLFALAMSSGSGTVSVVVLAVPCMLYAAFQAPLAASVQNVVPPQHRALASALLTLAANLLGLGLGPTAVGLSSDALAARFGSDSLRVALLLVPVAGFAACALLWFAQRTLRRQILALPGAESCPSPG